MRYLKWRFLIFGILSICIVFFSILYLCHFLFPIPQEWLKVQGNSPQIFAENGEALMQFLNKEEQWQFDIPLQKISPFFLQALVSTEDKNFYSHNGIDFIAIFRAIIGNITRTRTYSGASTISTQCIRLLTDRSRNILTKIYEAFRAWQLEKIWTKDQILEFYCNHTPYGGNIVGVQAASWRYFDKDASQLSLSEASLLAGLPQSPNRYRPDRYWERAIVRQQYVLERMYIENCITLQQKQDALQNSPILRLSSRAFQASHFCFHVNQKHKNESVFTSLNMSVQEYAHQLLQQHLAPFQNEIHHGAILIVDTETGKIISWIGSANFFGKDGQLDGIRRKRSPGSLFKPFTYAYALEHSLISPEYILMDLPLTHSNYTPYNFDKTFQGPVSVRQALRDSLNVPAVRIQEKIGTEPLLHFYHSLGLHSLQKIPEYYGLSLTLGGGEVSLWELVQSYLIFARLGSYIPITYYKENYKQEPQQILSPETAYLINDILKDTSSLAVISPNAPPFAWKTGTSSHHKDAWTIAYNPNYTIGVWIGNFDGKSSSHLVGIQIAAPIASRLMQYLMQNKPHSWYTKPKNIDTRYVCRISGMLPHPQYCKEKIIEIYDTTKSLKQRCNIHVECDIDSTTKLRVCPFCKTDKAVKHICEKWPLPMHTWLKNQQYPYILPDHNPECTYAKTQSTITILSPKHQGQYILEKNKELQYISLHAISNTNTNLYWFDNQVFIQKTTSNQKILYALKKGTHNILCMDENGASDSLVIHVHSN